MTSLNSLLLSKRGEGPYITHVSLFPQGKYYLQREDKEKFWKLYCEAVTGDTPLGLAERPSEYLPVLADIDLKELYEEQADSEPEDKPEILVPKPRLYTQQDVLMIIQIYQDILGQIVDNVEKHELCCVLLEKEPYTVKTNGKTYLKNGFHLHFPYIFLPKPHQEVHLIPRVKEALQKELKNLKIFQTLTSPDVSKIRII